MTKQRLILLVLLLALIVGLAKRARERQEAEWHGITEHEARAKLDAKLPGKIPAEKRSAISDKVVAKMRDRGAIVDDPVVPDDASSITADADDAADVTTS